MKKTIKVSEVVILYELIKNIIENDKQNVVNPNFKFKLLMLLHNTLTPIYNEYENTRVSLIQARGVETKNEKDEVIGMELPNDEDVINQFKADMQDIQNNDVEINFTPISASELFSAGLDIITCERLIKITKEYKGE